MAGGIVMFCPGCGFQVSDDLKFCKQCGANLRGAREALMSSSTEEKPEWNKTWRESLQEEARKQLNPTPEEKRLTEIKEGVLTIFAGVGAMIFLYFFFEAVAKRAVEGADIIRSLYWLGIVLGLIGAGMISNGLFLSPTPGKTKNTKRKTPQVPCQAQPRSTI